MKIIVNGEEKQIQNPANIKYLTGLYKFDLSKIVIELNGKILKKEEWEQVHLKENDKIEIVSFVGGG